MRGSKVLFKLQLSRSFALPIAQNSQMALLASPVATGRPTNRDTARNRLPGNENHLAAVACGEVIESSRR
jgi:hypothetical protein